MFHRVSLLLPYFLVIMVLAMMFVPDSPKYLLKRGNIEGTRKSIQWLRGSEYRGVDDEISLLQKADNKNRDKILGVSFKDLLSKRIYLQPLLISSGLMFFQQFSGMNPVLFYLQEIFIKAGSHSDVGLNSFLVALVQVSGWFTYVM